MAVAREAVKALLVADEFLESQISEGYVRGVSPPVHRHDDNDLGIDIVAKPNPTISVPQLSVKRGSGSISISASYSIRPTYRISAAKRSGGSIRLVCSALEVRAPAHQLIKCFRLVEQETVRDHVLVVFFQDSSRLPLRDDL